jgi:Peptidase family M1 domain
MGERSAGEDRGVLLGVSIIRTLSLSIFQGRRTLRPRRPPARPPRRLPAALPVGVLAALLASAVLSGLGAAAAELPPPVYQLTMFARFDDATGVIHGSERLRWQNTSRVEIDELRFHLYLNAFANSRSTFMQESGGRLRGDTFDRKRWGYVEVESIKLRGGADLKPAEEFIAPDDGNADDRTVARYPLPEPLQPGGWVTLDIEFESQLPSIFARTGVHGDFVVGGQWFPKIAVFEDAGVRGRAEPGWNAHQFHAHSEFYADFGDYDVTLVLPRRYAGKIAATGRRVEVGELPQPLAEGQVAVRFVQRGVHDFAWSADPRFVVVEDTFDPARDVPAGLAERVAGLLGTEPAAIALPKTAIHLYLSPAHAPQKDRYLRAAKASIAGYGLRLGPYPYDDLTMIDAPLGAGGADGMEYPTFITLGTVIQLGLPPLRGALLPEDVVVHEFGHQYFYGMVASNEFEEAWLDEGINSYYEMVVMAEAFPPDFVDLGELEAPAFDVEHAELSGGRYQDPVVAFSWRYYSGGSYGKNSYPRPALTLRHLEGLLGPAPFARAMRAYFQHFQFRHPSTADFETTVTAESGRDLGDFFLQALHSTRAFDYSVRKVENERIRKPAGFFWRDGERVKVERDAGGDGFGDDEEAPPQYQAVALVYREGEFVQPVTVEFRFDDGKVLRREWAGAARWARWTFTGPAKLDSVEVDPDHLCALDVDRLNNGRRAESDRAPALALVTDLMYWLQSLFQAVSVLA